MAVNASAVAEVRRLGRTSKRWRNEALDLHKTSLSNGLVEWLNSIIKKLNRIASGFASYQNYRCRILRACGNVICSYSTPLIREEPERTCRVGRGGRALDIGSWNLV